MWLRPGVQVLAMQQIMQNGTSLEPFRDFVKGLRCPRALIAVFPSVVESLVGVISGPAPPATPKSSDSDGPGPTTDPGPSVSEHLSVALEVTEA